MSDAQQQQPTTTPAGWFADPSGALVLRWWNGSSWTNQTAPMPAPTPAVARQRIVIERNPYGVWSAIIGVIALLIPFNTALLVQPWNVVLLGPVAAGIAIWMGITGVKHARKTSVGRTASAIGVATGGGALVLVALYTFLNASVLFG